jgi:hypothetical protein
MKLQLDQPETGCCGMAGSFGFEKDKYDVSIAVGERVLLPQVRRAHDDELIIADGFSCREQIEETTDRHALHLADVLKMAMDKGPHGPNSGPPEKELVERRKAKIRSSKIRSAVALGAIAGGALWLALRRR